MKEEIKVKITCAALHEFLSRGYEAVSMESIAKLAAISKRTLYKYFPSKDELFETLVGDLLAQSCLVQPPAYDPKSAFEPQLKAIIDQKVESLRSPGYIQISRIVLGEFMKGRSLSARHHEAFMELEEQSLSWFRAARADGRIRTEDSDEFLVQQLHALIKSQIFYPALFGFKTVTDADIEHCKASVARIFVSAFC